MTLCNTCEAIFDLQTKQHALFSNDDPELQRNNFRFMHHTSVSSLNESQTGGCYICYSLWRIIAPYISHAEDNVSQSESSSFEILGSISRNRFQDICDLNGKSIYYQQGRKKRAFNGPTFSRILHRLGFSITLGAEHWARDFWLFNSLGPGKDKEFISPIQPFTGSDGSFSLIEHWIHECIASHQECLRSLQSSFFPTRVIDVGTGDEEFISLVVDLPPLKQEPYATLSHRWGYGSFTKLSRSNFAQMVQGIRVIDLPKTFRDAVKVVRRLGVRYLWIDSLCIFQDCTEDWDNEVTQMGSIYRECVFNIAATADSDGSAGLFFERDPRAVRPCMVSIDWTGAEDREPGDSQEHHCLDSSLWEDSVEWAPLNMRGWVVQERLLAPRVIHFGRQQVFFECHHGTSCEAFPSGYPDVADFSDSFKHLGHNITQLEDARQDDPCHISQKLNMSERIHAGWWNLVEAYSKCDLTKPEDKLVAISGVAEKLQAATGDQYIAGLWKSRLSTDLLWHTIDPNIVTRKNLKTNSPCPSPLWRAPTWSWAAIDGIVERLTPFWDVQSTEIICEVVDLQSVYHSHEITSKLINSHLVLRAPLGCVSGSSGGGYLPEIWMKFDDITVFMHEINILFDDKSRRKQTYREEESKSWQYWCIPILRFNFVLDTKHKLTAEVHYLLIEEGKQKGEYYRVGTFCTNNENVLTNHVFESKVTITLR